MNDDARFEDGDSQPLRLQVLDPEDLQIVATLVQDAVFTLADMSWQPAKRRFALLVNRFRWEDRQAAEKQRRSYERIRSMLVITDVLAVSSSGVDRRETDTIVSVLDVLFVPSADGAGRLELTLAGDGAIALEVECLDLQLSDVTKPYQAVSGDVPDHNISD